MRATTDGSGQRQGELEHEGSTKPVSASDKACCSHSHPHEAPEHGHDHDHHAHSQHGGGHDHDSDHASHSCCDHSHDHGHGHDHPAAPTSQTVMLTGLHCGDCASKLEKAVAGLEGVTHAEVTFATSKMNIRYDETKCGYDRIVGQIRNLGYDVSDSGSAPIQSVFRIEGMDCADCAQKLEKKIGVLPAVTRVSVNFGAAKMTVEHDGSAVVGIVNAVKMAGYTAAEEQGIRSQAAEQPLWKRNKKVVPTALAGLLFAAAWAGEGTGILTERLAVVLYAVSIAVGGYRIAKSGLYGLKARTVGMDFLMTIAAVGAALIGEWSEGAAVVFLFSLGETLEAYTMDRTRRSIRGLMDLAPKTALVRRDGEELHVPVEQLRIGDTILVKPGEKIAMDGVIEAGQSAVNQAPITGESIPVEKHQGDEVYAGTINEQGSLEVRVTKLAGDNTLSRIIHMVEEAQAQKAPSQRFVDLFAKYYTPAVIAIAVGIALIPPLALGQPFEVWFYRALMMLVVSCPCALVISTPVSIVAAIGNAARNGVLIKGGAHLERLGAITAIAFDKTGTLTAGVPQVTRVVSFRGDDASGVLALAAGIEIHSEHPLAQAIVRKAESEGVPFRRGADFVSTTGNGAQASFDGQMYYIGKPKWFQTSLGVSLESVQSAIGASEQEGQTVMLLGGGDTVIGMITVADQVRDNAKSVIGQLRSSGVRNIVMLTGDNQGTAKAVSDKLGGITYKAELLPGDKVSAMQEMMRTERGTAMVGDGVNDAPALATATVGIAMGAAGTDTALETADVALMADDLSKLPYAVRLSRKALRIIKQNIAFSLIVKAVFLLLIFTGSSTLWMAVLADTGSSLIVIANGMRLLRRTRALADTDEE
ncbi:heavy metal translocating P-type ATPase [Paenibacillus ginsengarvi]|nr:heavy metal translocating P-type ATPase [Paenibacillus ginsengarvi]